MSAITLTDSGLNLIRDAMKGTASLKVLYVAIGTNNTPPTTTDTKLGNEVYRSKIASYANGASVGEALINGYISQSEATGVAIAEVGFFGGNATATANSGTLLARGLYSHTHPASPPESIVLQLDISNTRS